MKTVQQLQWRQQYIGCSRGSDSAVAVEAAIQRLQWRQRFSGCSGGNEERNAEGRKEEKNFRQYIRKLVGGLYPK